MKICAVTVTYGDRGHFLKQVIYALYESTVKVDRIVIVDNGSNISFEDILSMDVFNIDIVKSGKNIGSAAGFKLGLQKAAESGCDLVWLLDDDNVPESCALEKILEKRKILGNNELHVFAAQRIDRAKYLSAATTNFTLEIKKNAFLGFTLTNLPRILWRRLSMNFKRESSLVKTNIVVLKKIFYGIYGGLLLHRIWLQKGLYPNENFYLYVDDTEYTTRLVQNGAEIYLVPESIIKDVDISWAQKSSGNLHPMLDMDVDTRRLYYTIRNSCYLSKARFVDNRFIFYTNIVLFIPLMFIRGIIHGNSFISMLKRFNLVLHAVLDGVQSRLGYKEIIPGM